VLEGGTAIEADTGDTGDGELHHQYVAGFGGGVIAGGAVDRAHGAVGKGRGVETRGSLRLLVVPQANRVLGNLIVGHDVFFAFIRG
jgi:hypothetical protein